MDTLAQASSGSGCEWPCPTRGGG